MARYLTRLWDEHSQIAHQNAREFVRALDADAPEKIASYVWQTVKAIRDHRKTFFQEVHRDAKALKKQKARDAEREAKKSGPPSGGGGPPPSSAPPIPDNL